MIRGRKPSEIARYDWMKGIVALIALVALFASAMYSCAPSRQLSEYGLADNPSKPKMPLRQLKGFGVKGKYIEVRLEDTANTEDLLFGRVQVDENGKWMVDRPIAPGTYKIRIKELDQKDEPVYTFGPYNLGVGAVESGKRKLSTVTWSENPNAKPAQRPETPPLPGGASLESPTASPRVVISKTVPSQIESPGKVVLKGIAPAGTVLVAYVNGTMIAKITSDSTGYWQKTIRLKQSGLSEIVLQPKGAKGVRGAIHKVQVGS